MDNDLAPAAQNKGFLPIYADLRRYKSLPLEAINHALEEALDDLTIPSSNSEVSLINKTSQSH